MIVELIGIPGSGKSTIAKYLAEYKGMKVIPPIGKMERYFRCFVFALQHPIVFFRLFRLLFRDWKSFELVRYKVSLLSISIAHWHKALGYKSYVLVDEGIVQRIFTLTERPLKEAEIFGIISSLKPFVVVSIRGGGFERFVKADDRYTSPRVRLGSKYISSWKETFLLNLSLAERFLAKRVPLIEVDNSKKDDLASIADAIYQAVEARVKGEVL